MLIALPGCRSASTSTTELVVTGSTTLLPIAEISSEGFQKVHPDVRVLVSGVGSSAGIEAVAQGTAAIGTSSRDLKEEEAVLGLTDSPVAFDGIAVIVNPGNKVEALTMDQLKGIFEGKITNWKEVGGEDMRIDLVNRDEASGTREAFKKIVIGKEDNFDLRAAVLPGTGQVRDVVSRTKGAVGYISLGFVESRHAARKVKALTIDGVEPTPLTIADETYPIRRTLHYFTKGAPSGLAKEYIDYVLSDDVQQGAVTEAGFIPITVANQGGEK
jgi:phosphate transport system substrate-binding protein